MKWYYILAIVIAIVVLLGILILLTSRSKEDKSLKEYPELLLALGGKDNVSEVSFKGSRVNVVLVDKKLIDKEIIKQQGVETIVVSNKKLTMVVGKNSQDIYNYLNNSLNA